MATTDPQVLAVSQTGSPAPADLHMTTAGDPPKFQPRQTAHANAGHHSNLHHLPRPVVGESQACVMVDSQTLAAVAQSNLLVLQMLARIASNC